MVRINLAVGISKFFQRSHLLCRLERGKKLETATTIHALENTCAAAIVF